MRNGRFLCNFIEFELVLAKLWWFQKSERILQHRTSRVQMGTLDVRCWRLHSDFWNHHNFARTHSNWMKLHRKLPFFILYHLSTFGGDWRISKTLLKLTKNPVFGLNRLSKKLSKNQTNECDTCLLLLLHHWDTPYEISYQLEQFWLRYKLFKIRM